MSEFEIDIVDPKELLEFLRWKEDMVVTTAFGERVWLRPLYNKKGQRIGITNCCLESDPCEWHKNFPKHKGGEA